MKTFKEIREATKWKKGDGRPRGGSHIENVKFWDLPDASLLYIRKDADDAMKANPKGHKAGKYADEVNDASTVLFWRKKNKIVVEEVENAVAESANDNDGKSLKVGDVVLFKSDVEQYGKITKISGSTLTVKPDGMKGGKFIGDYIGGDKVTTVESPDVWKESVELEEVEVAESLDSYFSKQVKKQIDAKMMTPAQLATLKKEYGKIDKIDPSSPALKKMKLKLKSLPTEVLQQIVDAQIKFIQWDAKDIIKGRHVGR